jgi:methylated-DNA-[protein]-cysteine S-methyltransferase
MLTEIPYGTTTTYGAIAEKLAKKHGIKKMSARGIGGAVGHNPISLIVPCHRVI